LTTIISGKKAVQEVAAGASDPLPLDEQAENKIVTAAPRKAVSKSEFPGIRGHFPPGFLPERISPRTIGYKNLSLAR
jgi:hypothetical protein